MLRQSVHDSQADVRQGADGERYGIGDEALDQLCVLETAHSMVDPFRTEHIESLPDVLRWSLLARVRHRMQAGVTRRLESLGELLRRMANLRRVEPDSEKLLAMRHGQLKS